MVSVRWLWRRSGSGVRGVSGRHRDDAGGARLVRPVLRDALHTRRRQPVRHGRDDRHGRRRRVAAAQDRTPKDRRRRRLLPGHVPSRSTAVLSGQSQWRN